MQRTACLDVSPADSGALTFNRSLSVSSVMPGAILPTKIVVAFTSRTKLGVEAGAGDGVDATGGADMGGRVGNPDGRGGRPSPGCACRGGYIDCGGGRTLPGVFAPRFGGVPPKLGGVLPGAKLGGKGGWTKPCEGGKGGNEGGGRPAKFGGKGGKLPGGRNGAGDVS